MDRSEEAKRAASRLIDIQEPGVTKMVAFHSIEHHMLPKVLPLATPLPGGGSYNIPASDYTRIRREYREAGQKLLDATEEMFKNANLTIETRLIEEKDPEDYIIRITEEENFDLVMLGYKGEHSKVKQVLLGSVAEKALNEASCDVLVVR